MSRRIRVIRKNKNNYVHLTNIDILNSPNQIIKRGSTLISSNKAKISLKNITNDEIHLFTQFYLPKCPQRLEELVFCLKENIKFFGSIHLLNEKIYSIEEMNLTQEEYSKINQIDIGNRLTYKNFLDYIKENKIKGYCILTNIDIFFDKSIFNLRKSTLSLEKSIFSISRTEYKTSRGEEEFMRGFSQDGWIIHSNFYNLNTSTFDILLGKPGCDNRVNYLFNEQKYKIYNPPYLVRLYHYHRKDKRDYTGKDKIDGPYMYAEPVRDVEDFLFKDDGITKQDNSYITEDDITDWVAENNGILYTRKYNNVRKWNYDTNFCCLTGNSRAFGVFNNIISDKLKNPVVLILLESDVISIPDSILQNEKVIEIFTWNKEKPNGKVKCFPIGLNKDRQYLNLVNTPKNIVKDKLIQLNFDVNSHPVRRRLLDNKELMRLSENIKYMSPEKVYKIDTYTTGNIPVHVTNKNYYKEMARFKFVISPRGGGEDCHRTWEALYLGSIPIVLSSSINEIYQDLPVLVVDDWSVLTENYLNKIWNEFQEKEWNLEKLYLNYWFGVFKNSIKKVKKINKINLITYSDKKFLKAKNRLSYQAEKFGEFHKIICYGPEDLDLKFREQYQDILTQNRGGGYWIWKYNLIKKNLLRMEENEILIYLDAGCHLNLLGKKRFFEYIELLSKSEYGLLSFQMHDQPEKLWTVKEIFKYFGVEAESEIGKSGQYMATVYFIKKNKHSMMYIENMLQALERNRNMFTDFYNDKGQADYFKDNRHEQSVSSILRKIMGSEIIPTDETWCPPFGKGKSLRYPIWAKRTKD